MIASFNESMVYKVRMNESLVVKIKIKQWGMRTLPNSLQA